MLSSGKRNQSLSSARFLHRSCEFFKILGLGKVFVDAGEADVGDRVEALEPLHHHFADLGRRNFGFAERFKLALDTRDKPVDPRLVDRALAAGDGDRAIKLFAFKLFASSFGFDDGQFAKLDAFERGEARAAILALPPPPDGRCIVGRARVFDLTVFMAAKGAAQD